jgi:hypothetical protein
MWCPSEFFLLFFGCSVNLQHYISFKVQIASHEDVMMREYKKVLCEMVIAIFWRTMEVEYFSWKNCFAYDIHLLHTQTSSWKSSFIDITLHHVRNVIFNILLNTHIHILVVIYSLICSVIFQHFVQWALFFRKSISSIWASCKVSVTHVPIEIKLKFTGQHLV